jgi:hypothetical protein
LRNHRGSIHLFAAATIHIFSITISVHLCCQESVQDRENRLRELISTDRDFARYPNLRQHVLMLVSSSGQALTAPDSGITQLMRGTHLTGKEEMTYLRLSHEELRNFLIACSKDQLTMLRAVGLIGRVVRWGNIILAMDGRDLENELNALHFSDGLSLPAKNAVLYVFIPDQSKGEPFQCYFLSVYSQSFTYSYPRKVYRGSLVIGGDKGARLLPGQLLHDQPPILTPNRVRTEIRYDSSIVGLYNIQGVGLPGVESLFGSITAMYSQSGTLYVQTSRFWGRFSFEGFEDPAKSYRFAIHPESTTGSRP